MVSIYAHERKMLRRSTWSWTITLCLLAFFFFSLFPAFSRDSMVTRKLLEAFPELIRELIGISLNTFFSPYGFYAFIFAYVILLGSIQAMNNGLMLLSKETRDKTIDFLLSKPITRYQVLTSKILAGLEAMVVTTSVYTLFTLPLVQFFSKSPLQLKDIFSLLLINLSLLFVQCIFFALGLLLSVIIPKIKSTISITLITVFSFFILDMFNAVVDDEKLRYILPYKYFNPLYILNNQSYEWIFLVITALFVIGAVAFTYKLNQKKDFLV